MKRMLLAVLLATLLFAALPARAEAGYGDFEGVYEFCSGVGAWNTELTVYSDGSFRGYFSDTDMGASELEGTGCDAIVWYCDFSGKLSALTRISDWEYAATVEALDEADAEGETRVEDNLLYHAVHAYGLSRGAELRLYRPGAPKAGLPAGYIDWITIRGLEAEWETLPDPGLYNITEDCGFVWGGYRDAAAELPALTANPDQGWFWTTPGPEEPAPGRIDGLQFPIQGVVVNCKSYVTLRAEPSARAAELARAPLGAAVSLYSNAALYDGSRYFVEAGYDGKRGYMCVEYIDAVLPQGLQDWVVGHPGVSGTVRAANAGTELILRNGPGSRFENLGLLFGGEVLGYLGQAQQDAGGTCWYRCSHYGEECWISAKYTVLTTDGGAVYRGSRGVF